MLAALFLLGLFLLLCSGLPHADTKSEEEMLPSAEAYRAALREEITRLCQEVTGVGKVTVLVNLSEGYSYVYARDTDGDCVSVGSGSGREAVLERVLPPSISGIGIVCDGGDNPDVKARLTALVSAALGIGTNKIYITS